MQPCPDRVWRAAEPHHAVVRLPPRSDAACAKSTRKAALSAASPGANNQSLGLARP